MLESDAVPPSPAFSEASVNVRDRADRLPTRRHQLSVRWMVLTLQCVALIGSYYCYDNPSALQVKLKNLYVGKGMDLDKYNEYYNYLYSFYSWPNVVLPFLGGFFTDKLGIRRMSVLFAGLVALGQLIFAIGLSFESTTKEGSWFIMFAGRIVFGLGGESLSVAQSAIIAIWFSGKELALALGMNLALARLGSVFNQYASPAIADGLGIKWALWIGFIICVVSLACTIWCALIDYRSEKTLVSNAGENGDVDEVEKEEINLWDVKRLKAIFWVLSLSCVTVYCAVLSFNNIAADFIHGKWIVPLNSSVSANTVISMTYLTAGCLSPFMGAIIDRVGCRAILNIVAAVLIALVHLALGQTTEIKIWVPIALLVVLGLCYSIYAAALWPSVALIVDEELCGTAYGVVTAIQNLGLAVVPLIVGQQFFTQNNYTNAEWVFFGLGLAGTCAGIFLNILDCKAPFSVLNLSNKKLTKLKAASGVDADETGVPDTPNIESLLDSPYTPHHPDVKSGKMSVRDMRDEGREKDRLLPRGRAGSASMI